VRHAARLILICLLAGVCGCASQPPLGTPSEDAARQAALLQACRRPEVPKAVFRTLIRWGGRELSLTEVVEPSAQGGFSVAGVTDIGSTLYAARIDPEGKGHIVSNALPFSNRWLLDGLVTELLMPWNGPDETCRLYRSPDETWTLIRSAGRDIRMFLFDEAGRWQEFRRFSGSHLCTRATLEWDEGPLPKTVRIDNPDKHYHVVRERVEGP
jgi:hypothetical protein